MADLFHFLVYVPIYNALAFFIDLVPFGGLGVGIIGVTVLVRAALFPLSWVAIRTQMVMRRLDPELKVLREKLKDNKEELAKKTMDLFKENKVNPFASFFLILIQLPVIIGLYLVLKQESNIISFDPTLLYSFIAPPTNVSVSLFGILDLSHKSILLAVLVAATQFLFARLMATPATPPPTSGAPSFSDDLQRSMSLQMRYVFPAMLGIVAYVTSAPIALYFFVSNAFSIGQELLVRSMHHDQR
jgi:YidC/Oxa1 family membrane protein insertase